MSGTGAADRGWSSLARELWDADGLALLLEGSADIIVVLDQEGRVRFANPAGQALLRHPAGALLGSDAFSLIHPDDRATTLESFGTVLETDQPVGPLPLRLKAEGGDWRHVEVVARNLLAQPAVDGVVLNIRDVTDRVAAETALLSSEERFRHLADNAPDFIFRFRIGPPARFEYASPAIFAVTGYTPEDLYARPELLTQLLDAEVMARVIAMDPETELLEPIEFAVHRADGTDVWVQLRLTLHHDPDGAVSVVDGIVRDLSQRKLAEDLLIQQALHDPLTGLPNRALFYDRLNIALHRADRLPSSPAVLFLDLDGFKAVNDRHGHAAGDELLRVIAGRLIAAVRPSDTVARLGGDEFLVLCDDITGDGQLDGIRDRIREAVAEPIAIAAGEVRVAVSIGATRAAEHTDADELLRLADEAMYLDKARQAPVEPRQGFLTRDPTTTGRRRRTDHPDPDPDSRAPT